MTIAFFSTKAKYIAITKAEKEVLWIVQFLAILRYKLPGHLVNLKTNNRGAILLTTNLEFYWCIKHIKV